MSTGAEGSGVLVVKRGQLLKWAGYAKGWRSRTFEVTAGGLLRYFRRPQDAKAARSFSMDAVSRMRMTETNKGTGIELYLGDEQFLMVAKDRQEAHRWMFALQMVKGKAVSTAGDVADLQRQLEAIQELDEETAGQRVASNSMLAPSPASMLSPTPAATMLSPTPTAMLSPTPAPMLSPTPALVKNTPHVSLTATESNRAQEDDEKLRKEREERSLREDRERRAREEERERAEKEKAKRELEIQRQREREIEGERVEKERAEKERVEKEEREKREKREEGKERAREKECQEEMCVNEKSESKGDEDPFEEEEVLSPIELMQRHKRQASNQSTEGTGVLLVKSPPGTVHLLDTQWKSLQLRTMQLQAFSRWANSLLPDEHRFSSIETAFADGVNLCRLATSLTGKEVEGCNFAPAHTAFKHMNVNRAIMHLKECGYDLPGIPAHEIITGRVVTVVTLLWSIFSQSINDMGWAGKVGQKALLAWSNEQAAAFGVSITNFRSSFQDGRALYALLATRIPDQVNFAEFSTSQRAELLDKGFASAEAQLSVPRLLDGTVCEGAELDPVSIMMYVYMLFNAVRTV